MKSCYKDSDIGSTFKRSSVWYKGTPLSCYVFRYQNVSYKNGTEC